MFVIQRVFNGAQYGELDGHAEDRAANLPATGALEEGSASMIVQVGVQSRDSYNTAAKRDQVNDVL